MDKFTCPHCGNTRRWRNLSTGPDGTCANCGVCGDAVVRPDITSSANVMIGYTDSTEIGDGISQTNHF